MDEYLVMIDTETTNDIDCPLVYDVGYAVIDSLGKIVKENSYVVAEIFLDKDLMSSAFFADKIPQYWEDIKNGKRILKRFFNIRAELREVFSEYGNAFGAHNARFDYRALNITQRWLTCSKYRYFFPYGIKVVDTLKMARKALNDNDNYGEFCYNNEYLTSRGRKRFTAEIIYRWLTNNIQFEESHTGLEDVYIEKEILMYCRRVNPDEEGVLWE